MNTAILLGELSLALGVMVFFARGIVERVQELGWLSSGEESEA